MTYEQELLARSMSHLDDDMIAAAHGKRKRLRRLTPWLAAAMLAVVMIKVYPYLRTTIDMGGPPKGNGLFNDGMFSEEFLESTDDSVAAVPGTQDPDAPPAGVNTPLTLGGATITMTEVSDTRITLTLVKTDDTPIYAALYGLLGNVIASTEPDYKDNGVLIRPYTVRLYQDGATEPTYELPCAPGTYEIVLDYTAIRNGSYPMQEYIGLYAYIGKDDKPVTVRLSLTPDAD